ncbi:MAG: hypothetical protein R3Y50_04585 [Rikenellaceae bacterium]
MENRYTEDNFVNEELSNEELFQKHVVKEDLDLVKLDELLTKAFSALDVE